MSYPHLGTIKRKDTIRWSCAMTDDAGAVDLTGWTVTSHVRSAIDGTDVLTLTATPANQGTNPGEFELHADNATGIVPGEYYVDIRFESPGGDSNATETVGLTVLEEVTPR